MAEWLKLLHGIEETEAHSNGCVPPFFYPYIADDFLVVTFAFLVVTEFFLVVTEIHLAFT